MSFSMAGRGARGPKINVTPLIDVLLTLIIVFMVVVSMDKESRERLRRFRSRIRSRRRISRSHAQWSSKSWGRTKIRRPW